MPRSSNRRLVCPTALVFAVLALVPAVARGGPNLLANGGFHTDLAGWQASGGSSAGEWSPLDHLGKPGSGSLRMWSPDPQTVANFRSDCFPVTAGKPLVFGADAHGPMGAPMDGQKAYVAIDFYSGANCNDTLLGRVFADLHHGFDASTWGPTQGNTEVPPAAQSAYVLLRTSNGETPAPELYFDDAYVYEDQTCAATAHVVCLADRRFRVDVSWLIPDGTRGHANLAAFSGDSARATFFDAANVEIVLKVLDGRPVNDRFWVFLAGLTNVQVALQVKDTHTGEIWSHLNPLNQPFAPVQDTSAFPGGS